MTRTIFNEGEYSFTITNGRNNRPDVESITLFFTCDYGKYKGQTLLADFPTNPKYLSRLRRFCDNINYQYYGAPYDDDFVEQFIGLRCNATVSIVEDKNVLRNVIKTFSIPTNQPEYNPLAEKKIDHFFQQTKKREIPFLKD